METYPRAGMLFPRTEASWYDMRKAVLLFLHATLVSHCSRFQQSITVLFVLLFRAFEADLMMHAWNDRWALNHVINKQFIFRVYLYNHWLWKKKNYPRFTFLWKCSTRQNIINVESRGRGKYFDVQHCAHNFMMWFKMQSLLENSPCYVQKGALWCAQHEGKKLQRAISKHLLICSSHMHCLHSGILIFFWAVRTYTY